MNSWPTSEFILYSSARICYEQNFCELNETFKDIYFVDFFVFPGTALETRLFIASLLVLAKRFSWFSIKMLNFQNVCFVYKWRIKSEDGYQIGRGMSPDTHPSILYHVMHFSQWEGKKVSVWVILSYTLPWVVLWIQDRKTTFILGSICMVLVLYWAMNHDELFSEYKVR